MLIDEVTIKIQAGNGGKGAVMFNKNLMSLGPTGGKGGNGGSIYFEGISNLSALQQFRNKKDIKAENGEDGKGQFRDGNKGEDLILKIPFGTVIQKFDNATSQIIKTEEILKINERIFVAKGGYGGKGNFLFRSSRNTSPKKFQEGLPGEKFIVKLELKFIADVGIIGLPNAGKSSLLNELTKSKSKVANYPFTTLEPNLGVYYGLILADIPGLIEGASVGKGLGMKFLRHIERVKVIFHLISAESEDPANDYEIIRKELVAYSEELAEKIEYAFLSKSDIVIKEKVKEKLTILKKAIPASFVSKKEGANKNIQAISVYDWDSLEKVKEILNNIESEKFKHK
jgi:GTP-binding protein